MSDWRDCRRKWWLGQYRGLRRREDPDFNKPTGIGNLVHECLEHYYVPGGGEDPLRTLARRREELLAEAPGWEDDILKQHDLCEAMLTGYMEWLEETGADQALDIVAAETAVTAPLMDGVEIVSKLDVRINHAEFGSALSMDHKTVQSLTDPVALLALDTQMLTQHLCEYVALGDDIQRARGVLYNMLKKVKRTARANPPFFARYHVRHNVQQLRTHWQHVLRVAIDILDAQKRLREGVDHHLVVPPSPSRDCTWKCPFFKVCSMADDGSDFEGALAANYEPGNPLERYSELLPDLPRTAPGQG